ncbi:hypothetical protein ACFFRR_003257 [Megaselia abdita]
MFRTSLVLTLYFIAIKADNDIKANPLPSFVQSCQRSSVNLNDCVQDSIESLIPMLSKGIPELFIPPLDPLHIPEVTLEENSGAVVFSSSYKNISVKGLSRFGISSVEVNPKIPEFRFKFYFPEIQIKANYSVTGKIMLMPLQGDGLVRANFTDVDATVLMTGRLIEKDEHKHIEVIKIHPEYTIGGSKVHLENLFNGDEKLGSAMNSFLNENWKSVSEEIRPIMEELMASMLDNTASKLFNAFSFDTLLPL